MNIMFFAVIFLQLAIVCILLANILEELQKLNNKDG